MSSSKRRALSKKTRFEVFKRDGFRCHYCGATPDVCVLNVDHIVPVAGGGDNHQDNLITACWNCNSGKGATPLSSVPESLSEKAARITEQEQQIAAYTEAVMSQREREDDHAWKVADIFLERFPDDSIRKDWFQSIKNFNKLLGLVQVMEAMEISTSNVTRKDNCFRYFCGVCWNKVRGSINAQG